MNMLQIPTAEDLRNVSGTDALRHLVAVLRHLVAVQLIDAKLTNDATETVISMDGFDFITPSMQEAIEQELRDKGYTVMVDVDQLAVTWVDDFLG